MYLATQEFLSGSLQKVQKYSFSVIALLNWLKEVSFSRFLFVYMFSFIQGKPKTYPKSHRLAVRPRRRFGGLAGRPWRWLHPQTIPRPPCSACPLYLSPGTWSLVSPHRGSCLWQQTARRGQGVSHNTLYWSTDTNLRNVCRVPWCFKLTIIYSTGIVKQ